MTKLKLLDGPVDEFPYIVIALEAKQDKTALIVDEENRILRAASISCEAGASRFYRDHGIDPELVESTSHGWLARVRNETETE